jgi:hypothetical protein
MKRIGMAAFLVAIFSPASAQISSCKIIENGSERAACYDNLFPPSKSVVGGKAPKHSKPGSYDEESLREEAKMKRLLRPICTNCESGQSATRPRSDQRQASQPDWSAVEPLPAVSAPAQTNFLSDFMSSLKDLVGFR